MSSNIHPEIRSVKAINHPGDRAPLFDAGRPLASTQLDLREVLRVIFRRKGLIICSVAVFALLALIIAMQLTPLYRANALLMLDARQTKVIDVQSVVSGLPADLAVLRSEIDVIMSRALASRVVDRLQLVDNPYFAPVSDKSTWLGRTAVSMIKSLVPEEWWDQVFGPPEIVPDLTTEEIAAAKRDAVIDLVMEHLKVQNTPNSYSLTLLYAAPDPKLAAAIANAYASEYLVDQLEAKFEKTSQANEWLSQRLEDLRLKVQAAERAVEAYRTGADLIKTGSGMATVTGQQLSELNTQLIIARTERAQAEARLRAAQEGAQSPEKVAAVADVLASPLIQKLREQESTVRRREAELSSRYGPSHPTMINARAELQDLQSKIAEEVRKVIQGLSNQVQIARAKERSLADSLADLERKSGQNLRAEVQLRELEREAQASQALYEHFLNRFKETSDQQGMQQSDARIIARAAVPTVPYFPRTKLFVAGGAAFGALMGVLLAFLVEHLLRGLYDLDQVERVTGYPALGVTPNLRRFGAQASDTYVIDRPTSAYAERLRTIRTGVQFANIDDPPRIVMVTSALPREGKTTFCVSLARLVASSGLKVLLLDCDLRRPGLARLLPDTGRPGIAEIAVNPNIDPADLTEIDEPSGLHYIIAREGTPNPQELLGSKRIERFIRGVAQGYDLVIIDTPPVRAVADAAPISRICDVTVFLVRWAETPRETVIASLKQLASYGAKIAGIALTRVDMKKYAAYGDNYHQYDYYYRS